MFTIEQIEQAHARVKSGADFPKYIKEIKDKGVQGFVTWVKDSHTEYFGSNQFRVYSKPKYDELKISEHCDLEKFKILLLKHQQGETDYFTFCNDCAHTGIEKWIVQFEDMTCTYYDTDQKAVLVEQIPSI
jgi:uncharacterized protein YbcV (DUF1398 family)